MTARRRGTKSPRNGGGIEDSELANITATGSMWSNKKGDSLGLLPGRRVLGPLFLMVVPPHLAMIVWHVNVNLNGSFAEYHQQILKKGFLSALGDAWPSPWDPTAWKMIAVYAAFELLLMRVVPGKKFLGPVTPAGNTPVYKANGLQCYFISLAVFLVSSMYLRLFNMGMIYDYLGNMLSSMQVFAFSFCLLLYFKGKFFPSSSDSGTSGNFLFDYYWGTELYPRIFGWDIKMFTNCRFGMMFWAIGIIAYAGKQYETYGAIADSMLVSVGLQLVYITKFFAWETGYLRSIDIMHDRAGYYICYGCLCFLPSIYTSPSMYLVKHPVNLGPTLASSIFIAGCFSIWANYDADRQRQHFRAVKGDCRIWGRPARYIEADYTTEDGKKGTSLLLTSGWWGLSRHFHYVPEIAGAFCWSVPALFDNFSPYFYVCFLTILLFDRSVRDDARCRSKYGAYWQKYCRAVPSKIIPFIF